MAFFISKYIVSNWFLWEGSTRYSVIEGKKLLDSWTTTQKTKLGFLDFLRDMAIDIVVHKIL